jgi:hypothetical protein
MEFVSSAPMKFGRFRASIKTDSFARNLPEMGQKHGQELQHADRRKSSLAGALLLDNAGVDR